MPPLIAVVGPTASGKTEWAQGLAEALAGEIVGADSRQVYRGLDIGTAKPTPEQRRRVPHHCLDHVDPRERYHLARFLQEARAALAGLHDRGLTPVLAGGTGQYVWGLLEGWDVPQVSPDPEFRAGMERRAHEHGPGALHDHLRTIDPAAAAVIPPGNVRRLVRALEVHHATGRPISAWWQTRNPIEAVIVAPRVDRAVLDARIDRRLETMFAAGLVEETRALLEGGLVPDAPGLASIGYRQVVSHLQGGCTRAEALADAQAASRRLARRQAAWFRPDDQRIRWCDSLDEARGVVADATEPRCAAAFGPTAAGQRTIGP